MMIDEDDILDDIPPRLRDQVLRAWEVSTAVNNPPVYKHFRLKLFLAFVWGMLLTPIGLLLCLTVLFLPVGVVVTGAAAYPLAMVIQHKVMLANRPNL